MKTLLKPLLLALLFTATGCAKQENCDCGVMGKFIYLKEPYNFTIWPSSEVEIVAHFYRDSLIDKPTRYITGDVPKEFRSYDTIYVSICCEYFLKGTTEELTGAEPVYRLKCIEEVKL